MAFKFRRRQKLFPGVYLNFSTKGISTTIGIKGFNINFSKSGTYLNKDIPAIGLYDRKKLSDERPNAPSTYTNTGHEPYYFLPEQLKGEIKSNEAHSVTSKGLREIKETFLAAHQERLDIQREILEVMKKKRTASTIKIISKFLIIGFITKIFDNKFEDKKQYLEELTKQLSECSVELDIELEESKVAAFSQLKMAFEELATCEKIWDVTSSKINIETKAAATDAIARTETFIYNQKINFINTSIEAMYFKNKNGSDIYIYPAFSLMFDNMNNFGMIELPELNLTYRDSRFLEDESIPSDTKILGETWYRVNKDGSPDKRFKDNYKIPIVEYGEITFQSSTGVNERFSFSDSGKARQFVNYYNQYLRY